MTPEQIKYRLSQLPQLIVVDSLFYRPEYTVSDELSNHPVYTLGYLSDANNPREVFCFYEESTPEMCLIKVWRDLALRKEEWKANAN